MGGRGGGLKKLKKKQTFRVTFRTFSRPSAAPHHIQSRNGTSAEVELLFMLQLIVWYPVLQKMNQNGPQH